MKKFMACCILVFLLGMWAEWVMLSNPTTGVVLYIERDPRTADDYKLTVQNSQGLTMKIKMPAKTWKDVFQRRVIEDKRFGMEAIDDFDLLRR